MPFRIQNSIPNALTLLNLFSGCLAIVFAFMGRLDLVPNCVAVSLLADFFDGFIARKIDFSSPIGPDLDSLADMVSFGVFPAILLLSYGNYNVWFLSVILPIKCLKII